MKFQRYMALVLITLVCIISISAVSAADDVSSDIISTDNDEALALDETIDDVSASADTDEVELTLADNDELISSTDEEQVLADEQTGSFTDLNNLIDSGKPDSIITLTRNYKYTEDDNAFNSGIVIDYDVIINGGGFTIDGSNQARIFNITANNVILNDITFINGYRAYEEGAAIKGKCTAINCNFINNTIRGGNIGDGNGGIVFAGFGGAMGGGNAINCTFINNDALSGGAIASGEATLCTFINNTNSAVIWGTATLCTVIDNEISRDYITPATFIVEDFTSTYKSGEKLFFNILAGNKLYDGINTTINVYQGDNLVGTYYALTGYNGGWAINLDPGEYNAVLSLDNIIGVKNSTVKIKILGETTIKTNNLVTAYNSGDNFIITLNYGKPLSGVDVTVDFNGVKTYKTDQNGQIKISTNGLAAGTYNAKISYAGDEYYSGSTANAVVKVNKAKTKITAPAVTATYNVDKNLVITLKDSNGKALSNAQIIVYLDGIKKLTTDKNGQVKISTKGLAPKTYSVDILYNGNSNYVDTTLTTKLTVKKATPTMTASAKSFKVGVKTKKYSITLKDNKGKVMKNTKVTLTVNKKTYTVKTNSKGVATFAITNLNKKGKFTAVVKYAGSSNYNKVTKKPVITITA